MKKKGEAMRFGISRGNGNRAALSLMMMSGFKEQLSQLFNISETGFKSQCIQTKHFFRQV